VAVEIASGNSRLSPEYVDLLAGIFMPTDRDRMASMPLDIISHKAAVLINSTTGDVSGITESFQVSIHATHYFETHPENFEVFVRDQCMRAAKYSFAFFISRLDLREKTVPITIIPATAASATNGIRTNLTAIRHLLLDGGVDVRGIAFDRDKKI
jgi:hypothetical protein